MTNIVSTAQIHSWKSFGEAKGFEYKNIDGTHIFKSGIDNPFLNYATITEYVTTSRLDQALDFFGTVPFVWICDTSLNSVDSMLEELGFTIKTTWPGMVLPLENFSTNVPDEIKVIQVTNESHLNDWITAGTEGFQLPRNTLEDFFVPLVALDDQRLFVAYIGDEPVSGCLSSICHKTALIAYLATKPTCRGRGAGRAITATAVLDAKNQGCTMAALQASAMGESLYRKVGFEPMSQYNLWVKSE